jgi:hypothetical protein
LVRFEVTVNGERRFVGDDVRAITVVSDRARRGDAERVSVHVGAGEPGQREVQYLGSDLAPGDEISIRVLADEAGVASTAPDACSFCGSDVYSVRSLVAGPRLAICDACLLAFDAVLTRGAALPVGASIQERGERHCGFCRQAPPEVPGLFVRHLGALCPQCLRACVEMTSGERR